MQLVNPKKVQRNLISKKKKFAELCDNILKRISIRYSGDAHSFQYGMQLLIWGEKWSH